MVQDVVLNIVDAVFRGYFAKDPKRAIGGRMQLIRPNGRKPDPLGNLPGGANKREEAGGGAIVPIRDTDRRQRLAGRYDDVVQVNLPGLFVPDSRA